MTFLPRDYRLHELSYGEFEDLCGKICIAWLGEGFTPFAAGPDGGRDGKFNGTANSFPSMSEPLVGHAVLQAKHTVIDGRSCSDDEFARLLRSEHPKILRLIEEGICDHYIVFTNRKLTGGADEKLIAELNALGLTSAFIVGTERLKTALDTMRDLREALPNRSDTQPFRFEEGEMVAVVDAFHRYTSDEPQSAFDSATDFEKIPVGTKNKLNGLSVDYYEQAIRADSMPHFRKLEEFLRNPRNVAVADRYYDAADELKQKILVERTRFETFDHVLLFIIERVQQSDPALRGRRRLVSILTHYMYVNCDIGKKTVGRFDAAS